MDAFTFGMFGELETYEDVREYEEWLDSTESAEEMSEDDLAEIDRQEAQKEEDDWWNY